jgi:hypothetical protein
MLEELIVRTSNINKLKKYCSTILLLLCLPAILGLNGSFKNPSVVNIGNQFNSPSLKDTVIKHGIPMYADSSLYSGYLGNSAPVRSQILDSRRIDRLLKAPIPICYALTENDKKAYVLSIDQNSIKKLHDTTIFGEKSVVTYLPLRLTNYSNDTLKDVVMDCSWLDSYFTNNNKIEFEKQICYKNEPCVQMIPPHESSNVNVAIVLKGNESSFNRKFRIGMSLQKFISKDQLFDFDAFVYMLRPETGNMIWSNEVELP